MIKVLTTDFSRCKASQNLKSSLLQSCDNETFKFTTNFLLLLTKPTLLDNELKEQHTTTVLFVYHETLFKKFSRSKKIKF